MNRIPILKSAAFLLFVFILVGCKQKTQDQSYQGQTVELPVAMAQKGNTTVLKEYSANIEGVVNVEIRPQVSGYLEKIYVDEGAYVKAGQVLFKIDSRSYHAQYDIAKANLETAKINLNRKKELVANNMVSVLQLQEAKATYNAAESAVELARINYEFCTIQAPVSGYIGRIPNRVGSLVDPSSQTSLTLLSDINQVYAYFSMGENDFLNFQAKLSGNTMCEKLKYTSPVSLIISNGIQYDLQGKIDAVEGQFNKNTGSIILRAKFNNPKSILRTGNTGKVVLEDTHSDVILIPIASTLMIQDRIFIFSVDKQSNAVQIPIEVKGKSGNNYIVSGGIKSGEKYITKGFERLQTGTPIIIQKATNK